ncbi:hypothetical protein H5410_026012, partial [Solanum commersonii]
KLNLDMANDEKYVLPDSIFTCETLTYLKLSRCILKHVGTQFPNHVSLQFEDSAIAYTIGLKKTLNQLMLEILELRFCVDIDSVYLVSPSTRELTHCSVDVPDRSRQSLKLQSLKICDFKISVENEVVKIDETLSQRTDLLCYLSMEKDHVNEAMRLIQTVRLRKFKGSSTGMYLIRVLFSHSPKLVRMIIEQCEKLGNPINFKDNLRELLSFIYNLFSQWRI